MERAQVVDGQGRAYNWAKQLQLSHAVQDGRTSDHHIYQGRARYTRIHRALRPCGWPILAPETACNAARSAVG
eukprot:scaffold226024_cov36-Tisochrysis_lutea.AAC.4